jgi:hypothetical protein
MNAQQLKQLFLSLQFIWGLGHALTFVSTLCFLLKLLGRQDRTYSLALMGVFLSYSLILYKTYVPWVSKRPLMQWLPKMMMDENSLYMFLGLHWFSMTKPLSAALIPYATFALFHLVSYFGGEFIPRLLPKNALGSKLQSLSKSFVTIYQPKAVHFVSTWEVWILFPLSLVGILFRFTSFWTPLAVFQFIRFKYMVSPATQVVVHDAISKVDGNNLYFLEKFEFLVINF